MIRLNENQLAIVTQAARALPIEKRQAFALRVEGLLRQRTGRHNDADVAAAAQLALNTLIVNAA